MATITKRPRKALLLHDTEGTKNFGRKTNCLARLRYSSSFNYAASNRLKAMSTKLKYTDGLKDYLRLDAAIEANVVRELKAHLEDKSRELIESGLSKKEATATATRLLGSPRIVAKQMYEVYSQGSWRQAFFAAQIGRASCRERG